MIQEDAPELLTGQASAEGSRRYAERLAPRTAPGHFRRPAFEPLELSSLGLGSYLGAEDDATDAGCAAALPRCLEQRLERLRQRRELPLPAK